MPALAFNSVIFIVMNQLKYTLTPGDSSYMPSHGPHFTINYLWKCHILCCLAWGEYTSYTCKLIGLDLLKVCRGKQASWKSNDDLEWPGLWPEKEVHPLFLKFLTKLICSLRCDSGKKHKWRSGIMKRLPPWDLINQKVLISSLIARSI